MKFPPITFKRNVAHGRYSLFIGRLEIAYVKRGNRWRDWRTYLPRLYWKKRIFWLYWPWFYYYRVGKSLHQAWRGIGFISGDRTPNP